MSNPEKGSTADDCVLGGVVAFLLDLGCWEGKELEKKSSKGSGSDEAGAPKFFQAVLLFALAEVTEIFKVSTEHHIKYRYNLTLWLKES